MRKALVSVAVLAALAACEPKSESPAEMASVGCQSHARAGWKDGDVLFSITATADGPVCEKAAATLTVRGPDGSVLLTEAFATEQVIVLAGKKTGPELDAALLEWIDPAKSTIKSADALPEWKEGVETPTAGEFPFYPDIERADYEKLRAAKKPLYCFIQGMESIRCYVHEDGQLRGIGVQTFPG